MLALDKYPTTEIYDRTLEYINMSFSFVFILEMVVKLLGLGISEYFIDNFNKFDFIVVLLSTIDLTLTLSTITLVQGSSAISALRAFRLIRVFKIVKSWK